VVVAACAGAVDADVVDADVVDGETVDAVAVDAVVGDLPDAVGVGVADVEALFAVPVRLRAAVSWGFCADAAAAEVDEARVEEPEIEEAAVEDAAVAEVVVEEAVVGEAALGGAAVEAAAGSCSSVAPVPFCSGVDEPGSPADEAGDLNCEHPTRMPATASPAIALQRLSPLRASV
jgi:hypothetical protein